MAMRQRAEFLVINENGAEQRVVANNVEQAAKGFETTANPVIQVTRDHLVKDVYEDVAVSFVTKVTPAGAVAGKCYAYPIGEHEAKEGDKVIFTAVPNTGWDFVGWFVENVETATSSEAVITVQKGTTSSVVYEARFTNT